MPTEETHQVTRFEFFFDLVWVFALTRVSTFAARAPTPLMLVQGMVLLLLIWWSFGGYIWLANQARADVGLPRAGMIVVMTAIFVGGIVLPEAWQSSNRGLAPPMIFALVYVLVRLIFVGLSLHLSAGQPRPRAQLPTLVIPVALGWVPLVLGAVFGGNTQTVLWATAFLIDGFGRRIAWNRGGHPFQVPSPGHAAERFGMVLIIALGVSLASVGVRAGSAVTRSPVLIAAVLTMTEAVCLFWLYFENTASCAADAIATLRGPARVSVALDAYGLIHFLLIAGVIYLAVGVGQVLTHLIHHPPGHAGGDPLGWTSTVALFGGVVLYLAGRALFLLLTVRHIPPVQLVVIAVMLVLLPVARYLPALAALGLLTTILVALVAYERLAKERRPSATAR